VDTISSLDLYPAGRHHLHRRHDHLRKRRQHRRREAPVTVNLDGTSKWVVTGNSTVTNLNAAEGAQIVDEDGKTVTIVANGKTVVPATASTPSP
jgi:hypothetical protein